MRVTPPCKVSQEKIVFDAAEIEAMLQPPPLALKPYPPAYITLTDKESGKKKSMVIREAKESEIPMLAEHMRRMMDSPQFKEGKDYYDIVVARVYAELLGVMRKRLKDPYTFVGLVDGELAGFCNGRLFDEKINISLHSVAISRGMRAGATMYFAKCEYCFDILGQDEFQATYESINGLKRWGLGMCQPSKQWPEIQHELGGAKVFYITKKYWEARVKKYLTDLVGTTLVRPVPKELMKKNETMRLPKSVEI